MKIALLLVGVQDQYCGGAERFFSDFFDIYNSKESQHQLYFLTDHVSLKVLKSMGKLKHDSKIICLKEWSNRFKNYLEAFEIKRALRKHKIDILHITSYTSGYYNRVQAANQLTKNNKLKIIVNIVDPELPYTLRDINSPKYKADNSKWEPVFSTINVQGVYSWYKLFKEFAEQHQLFKSKPYIEAVKTRFSNIGGRLVKGADKRKEIIWAARMVPNKQPVFFVEAVNEAKKLVDTSVFNQWKFRMFGKGPLLEEVKSCLKKYDLETNISVEVDSDLANVFSVSTCFVSTQDYENFPSQSMNEAMVAGNVIVSRNVGQTEYFVKDKVNGYLSDTDTPQGLGSAIQKFMENEQAHVQMMKESIRITREVHNPENFIRDIDIFWNRFK